MINIFGIGTLLEIGSLVKIKQKVYLFVDISPYSPYGQFWVFSNFLHEINTSL